MSIDERLKELMDSPWMNGHSDLITQRRAERVRDALLQMARDQCNACAEALAGIHIDDRSDLVDVGVARQAVMNATIK